MERKRREPYAAEMEREVREQDARIAATEARARRARATDPIEELNGVRVLQATLKESVERLKRRDEADWEMIRSDVEEALSTLVAALREINARLDELEQTSETGARLEPGRRPRAPSHL
jgi:hypothetical protein